MSATTEAPARRTVTMRTARVSARVSRRTVLVSLATLAAAVTVGTVCLTVGDYPLTVAQVLRALVDGGSFEATIVREWRLPRVVAALAFGAAMGASGAVFQSLTRNPLGSPDVIGFGTGAYTGALIAFLTVGGGFGPLAAGALIGGLVTAVAVYLLARREGAAGLRLIIVGIGVSATLTAVNYWILLNVELDDALSAAVWGAGSLNGVRWEQVAPAAALLVPLVLVTALASRPMRTLELGPDAAAALGVRLEPVRLLLIVLAVALVAGATAVAGPVAFVALSAPQLALRLTRSAGTAILPAACMGTLVLVASDLAAMRLFSPVQLPVGVLTVCVGGTYLVWLLIREARR